MQHRLLLIVVLLFAPMSAMAQDHPATTTSLPDWDQLTSAQRDELIAPLRDRWNRSPEDRSRLIERARRWTSMPPDTRQRAHHGMQRWEKMSPEQRLHAKALFHALRRMDSAERKAFLAKWHEMPPQQRSEWVEAHPAPQRRRGPGGD